VAADDRVLIRAAGAADAPAIATVHVASWQATYPGLLPAAEITRHTLEGRTAMWTRLLDVPTAVPYALSASVCVAIDGDRLVGFANSGPFRVDADAAAPASTEDRRDGELYALYLLPDVHGRGIGRRLFEAAADDCRASGFGAMRCWVLDGNPAIRFYERLGGVRTASKTFRAGGEEGIDVIEHGYRFELARS
jgi:GNAT superfamily N-acetyltransferase